MADSTQVAIVGAGAAGLATARALATRGLRAVVFEAGDRPGDSWRRRYDRLRLHTGRRLSSQPGLGIPERNGPWVAARDFADYLEDYARFHRLEVLANTPVRTIERAGRRWRLQTPGGAWDANTIVVATGYCGAPHWPAWARSAGSDDLLVHSRNYRNPLPYIGRDVLVVGCGNSGSEIAADLAEGGARRVRLSIRSGPTVVPRAVFGLPTHALAIALASLPPSAKDRIARLISRLWLGDLGRLGVPAPTRGLFERLEQDRIAPVLDCGFVAALAARKIEIVPGVEALAARQVRLVDGTTLSPDAVIAATGFEPALDQFLGGVVELTDRGLPRLSETFEAAGAPGLYLAGFLVAAEGTLWAIARQSERIAAAIARQARAGADGKAADQAGASG